jgi:hypothetical protein
MKRNAILLLLLFICFTVSAQNEFLVYAAKGNVQLVQKGVESKARIGALLSETDQVMVPAGGSVSLICNQMALFTLNTGMHKMASLNPKR